VVQKDPKVLLHGHEPLTRVFRSTSLLAGLAPQLRWLEQAVCERITRGEDRARIQQENLIPPGLLQGDPELHLPYLVLRENVINRVYDQHAGYWHSDLEGLDYISQADQGRLLGDYLGVSASELDSALERLISDGKYELAARALAWTDTQFPASPARKQLERRVYLKLMEKHQNLNPFKFIIYAGKIGVEVPPMR
jgi:hypothetical protein